MCSLQGMMYPRIREFGEMDIEHGTHHRADVFHPFDDKLSIYSSEVFVVEFLH